MSRQNLSDTRHNYFWREVLFLLKLKSLLPRLYSDLCLNINRIMPRQNTINSYLCRGKNTINSYHLPIVVWCHTWYRGRYRESKMATSGDSSPLNQLLGRIMQTIRSVQRSVDGGVDSNILQRNISIIGAVQIQLVRIETLFSDHESRVLYDQLQTEVQVSQQ